MEGPMRFILGVLFGAMSVIFVGIVVILCSRIIRVCARKHKPTKYIVRLPGHYSEDAGMVLALQVMIILNTMVMLDPIKQSWLVKLLPWRSK